MNELRTMIVVLCFLPWIGLAQKQSNAGPENRIFAFEKKLHLPGTPTSVYNKLTGDVSPWWDHTFSGKPDSLYIDARPGGGFYELFDKQGNGVKHADVIYAHRGKLLRLDGPLGLSGRAVKMVSSFYFEPLGNDSTVLRLEVRASGDLSPELPAMVEKVWDHFLIERFRAYLLGKL